MTNLPRHPSGSKPPIVKLVEAQRPTVRETTIAEVQFDRLDRDLQLHQFGQALKSAPKPQNVGRNAPCHCGSPLKYERLLRQSR